MPEKTLAQEGYITISVDVTPVTDDHPVMVAYLIDMGYAGEDPPRELELWGSEWGMLCAAIDAAREALR